jgi:hypothetical protein
MLAFLEHRRGKPTCTRDMFEAAELIDNAELRQFATVSAYENLQNEITAQLNIKERRRQDAKANAVKAAKAARVEAAARVSLAGADRMAHLVFCMWRDGLLDPMDGRRLCDLLRLSKQAFHIYSWLEAEEAQHDDDVHALAASFTEIARTADPEFVMPCAVALRVDPQF